MALTLDYRSPLEKLNSPPGSDKYSFELLKYPLNFDGIFTQGHYMNFYINVHMDDSYYQGNPVVSMPSKYLVPEGSGMFGISSLTGSYSDSYALYDGKLEGDNGSQGSGMLVKRKMYKRIKSAISLYIPNDDIRFKTSADWNKESLTARGGGLTTKLHLAQDVMSLARSSVENARNGYGKYSTGKTTSAMMAPWAIELVQTGMEKFFNFGKDDFLLGSFGFAINPNYLVLYKGLGLRDFSFKFVFVPSNQQEALNVRNIIKTFRFHAAPEVFNAQHGSARFHVAPSTFDIEFFYKNNENTKIPKISTCALTNIDVNYAPHSWTTFVDGMPVMTEMQLHFQEMELITKDKINQGF